LDAGLAGLHLARGGLKGGHTPRSNTKKPRQRKCLDFRVDTQHNNKEKLSQLSPAKPYPPSTVSLQDTPSLATTHNGFSPNTPPNRSLANVASEYKQSSTSYGTAHDTTQRAANTSPPTAAYGTSHRCSPTRSAFNRCYDFWRRQEPALNRGRRGNRDRLLEATKRAGHPLHKHTRPPQTTPY
jgi:hypothetical protein